MNCSNLTIHALVAPLDNESTTMDGLCTTMERATNDIALDGSFETFAKPALNFSLGTFGQINPPILPSLVGSSAASSSSLSIDNRRVRKRTTKISLPIDLIISRCINIFAGRYVAICIACLLTVTISMTAFGPAIIALESAIADNYKLCHFVAKASPVIDVARDSLLASQQEYCTTEELFWSVLLKPRSRNARDPLAIPTNPFYDVSPNHGFVPSSSPSRKATLEDGLHRVTKELILRHITANDGAFHTKIQNVMVDLNSTLCHRYHSSTKETQGSNHMHHTTTPPLSLSVLEMFHSACDSSCDYCKAAKLDKMVLCLTTMTSKMCETERRIATKKELPDPTLTTKKELPDPTLIPGSNTSVINRAGHQQRLTTMRELPSLNALRMKRNSRVGSAKVRRLDTEPYEEKESWEKAGALFFDNCPSVFYNDERDESHPLWYTLGLPVGNYLSVIILALEALETSTLVHQTRTVNKSAHLLLKILSHKGLPKHRAAYKQSGPTWLTSPLKLPHHFMSSPNPGVCSHWANVLDHIKTRSPYDGELRESLTNALIAHGHSSWILAGNRKHKNVNDRTLHHAEEDRRELSSWIRPGSLSAYEFKWTQSATTPGGEWRANVSSTESLILNFPDVAIISEQLQPQI